jgi:hypothetical protein
MNPLQIRHEVGLPALAVNGLSLTKAAEARGITIDPRTKGCAQGQKTQPTGEEWAG